jgi:hypothetical protein
MGSSLTFEETPETNRGRLLYELLVSVHAHIRGERDRVERLAAAVVDGLPAEGLEQELEALRSNSMLWQFQLGCLRYCRFVHLHHRAEDADLFGDLDAVEASARALTEDDSLEARRSVADALEALAGHLLAHLEYEERSVAATARRLPDLTFSNQLREVADGDLPLRRTSNEHHPRT